MIVLTDMGEKAVSFFGASLDLLSGSACAADPLSQELAGHLSAAGELCGFRVESSGLPDLFPLMVLVERSSRSNLEALSALHRKGAKLPDGLVCVTGSGDGFLGRHNRSWRCEDGNLHAVIHLKPRITMEQAGCAFSTIAAISCVDAIMEEAPEANDVRIKWVNDVLANERKVAGFLTRQTYKDPLITDLFLGIGVNVLTDPVLPPNPFVKATGCLKELFPERAWSPGGFLLSLLVKIAGWYSTLMKRGNTPLLEQYRRRNNFVGRDVRIFQDGEGFDEYGTGGRELLAKGKVEKVLDDLSIRIKGVPDPLPRGRLAFEKDCQRHNL